MFATALYADEWNESSDDGSEYNDPDPHLIKAAIENLDGRRRTLVLIRDDDGASLVVAGGASGQYVVYGTFDNRLFEVLSRNANSDMVVKLNAGGQEGDYPKRWVVGIDSAIQARERRTP